MVSLTKLISIIGLALIYCITYTQQKPTALSPSDKQSQSEKAAPDASAFTSIPFPLFRGSNLGYFVRKRPFMEYPEYSNMKREDYQLESFNYQHPIPTEFSNNEQDQRRSDDYSDNPGPMFGR